MTSIRSLFVVTAVFSAWWAGSGTLAVAQERGIPVAEAIPVQQSMVPVSPADRDKTLGVGDQVTLEIMEDHAAPIVRRVTDTGELDVPYIGRVRATGKSTDQLAAEIKRKLEADYYYKATIRLGLDQVNRAAAMGRVYISGEVRQPGTQEYYTGDELSASAVILKAGGFTQFADTRRVKVVRKTPGGATRDFEVDMRAVLERGEVDKDMLVEDGDYVIVKRKLINW